ncbi:MAG: acetylglutamate kinase [Clostridia bacterium]|nr:acetylglutamate kinase [Erysipelotrichia bacterium]NCC87921.1 acetylglutamate kinase [Clostridia bacterium]
MKKAIEKATILSQALPYIQKYSNKIIVVKYGGNAMLNEELKRNVINDVVLLSEIGIKVVMVHGGGPGIDAVLKKMNKPVKFINGLRYTDEETMEVAQMVLAGKMNKDLVSMISQAGASAVGICGMDAHLIKAKKYMHDKDLGYVGEITQVNEKLIIDLLNNQYIPVIASIGVDENNHAYNINADLAAAAIASKLCAENMVLVSNIPGLLKDLLDESSLLSEVSLNEIDHLKATGVIAGGMIPKVNCCVEAIEQGVKKTCIIDGRVPHSLLIEILSDEGIGTMIVEG